MKEPAPHWQPPQGETLEISLPATLESVPQAIDFLKRNLENLGYSLKVQAKLAVIIDEIVSNIAKFAYGSLVGDVMIRLSAQRDGHVVEICFIDGGIAFNPLEAPRIDTDAAIANHQIGGQGILMVREIADEIEYERKDGKNVLIVRKHIER